MKRGVVIMKNIALREHNYLKYSTIQFNEHKKEKASSFRDILQVKLEVFEKIVQLKYLEMLNFASEKKKEQVRLSVRFEDMLYEYKQTIKGGVPLLNDLINQLNHKRINASSFQYMKEIFDHQIKMTKQIVEKDLSLERLETVYNHLLNVPYYLKTDLEIESLPNSADVVRVDIKEQQQREISSYNINRNHNFYKTGA